MILQKYDIILCKGSKHLISRLIRHFTKDIYNHSEIYLGHYLICDAMPNGTHIRPMDRSLGEFDAYRYKGTITAEQSKKIEEFIQKSINSKYDFVQLMMQAFGIDFGHPKKYICIELVISALDYAGIPVGTWRQGFKQITDNPMFVKVNKD